MYKPINSAGSLVLGTGRAVIVAGWTPVEVIKNRLNPEDYAVIGSLYNPKYGISMLLANLLANPCYNDIRILYATPQDKNTQAGRALYEFFAAGFKEEENYWAIRDFLTSKEIGRIDKVFTREHLQQLRDNCRNSVELTDNIDSLKIEYEEQPVKHNEPVYLEIPLAPTEIVPANLYGHKVEADTVAEVWLKTVQYIRSSGRLEGQRQEVINLTSVIHSEPGEFYTPEWLPVGRGRLEEYVREVTLNEGDTNVTYTYGSRLRDYYQDGEPDLDQVKEVARHIAKDPDSTRNLMCVWNTISDLGSSNPPCLTQIWARVLDNKLLLSATFRSHDIYMGYPSNLMAIRRLQDVLIEAIKESEPKLKLTPGKIICVSMSAHIYEHAFADADRTVKEHYKPKETYTDPVGYFVLKVEGQSLNILHYNNQHDFVREYKFSSKKPVLDIVRELHNLNPTIQAAHLAYLGIELQKMQQCAERGEEYIQDKTK